MQTMGFDELKMIAGELVTRVQRSAMIDWTVRINVQARIHVIVRRILRKFG